MTSKFDFLLFKNVPTPSLAAFYHITIGIYLLNVKALSLKMSQRKSLLFYLQQSKLMKNCVPSFSRSPLLIIRNFALKVNKQYSIHGPFWRQLAALSISFTLRLCLPQCVQAFEYLHRLGKFQPLFRVVQIRPQENIEQYLLIRLFRSHLLRQFHLQQRQWACDDFQKCGTNFDQLSYEDTKQDHGYQMI